MQKRCLVSLPDDILYLLLAYVDDGARMPLSSVSRFESSVKTGFSTLRPLDDAVTALSLTCRKMRQACLPLVFEFVRFSDRIEATNPPLVVCLARRVCIQTWTATPLRLSECLGTMPDVRTVYFEGTKSLLPVVMALPSLEVLALGRSQSTRQIASWPAVRSPLRIFRMCDYYRLWKAPLDDSSILFEQHWLASLISSGRSTLEELFIPGESTSLSMLASAPCSALKELTIHGAFPQLDMSWLQLLASVPNLRALTLAIAPRRDQPPLLVWPRDATIIPDISRLRRFSISFPSEDDCIFRHLPTQLEELSLRDTPRFYVRDRWPGSSDIADGKYNAPILTCHGLRKLFESLPATADLRRLEVVLLEDEHLLDLLAYLAAACPRLDTFEFHRYRGVFDYDELLKTPPVFSLDEVARALTAFKTLRVLRLNLEFQWTVFTVHGRCRSIRAANKFALSIAHTFAQALPWLRYISVLTFRLDWAIREWRTWAVVSVDGAVSLDAIDYGIRDTFSWDLSHV